MKHIMRLGNISLKSYRLIFRFSLSHHDNVFSMLGCYELLNVHLLDCGFKKHAPLHENPIDNVTSYKTHSKPRIIDVKYSHLKFYMYSCPEKIISL